MPIEFIRILFHMYAVKKTKIVENTIKRQVFKKLKTCTKLSFPPCYHAFLLSTHTYFSKYYCKSWSEGHQNGFVLNLQLRNVTAHQASKSDITSNKKATINLLKLLLGFKSIVFLMPKTQHTQACFFTKISVQNCFFYLRPLEIVGLFVCNILDFC